MIPQSLPAQPPRTAITLAAFVLLLAGCAQLDDVTSTVTAEAVNTAPAPAAAPNVTTQVPPGTADAASARTNLSRLRVAAPGSLTGYVRDCANGAACVFGKPWIDTDHDGCDQRSQVLARDLVDVQRKPGRCAVTNGRLADPYTGETVTTVSKIQVDHVVSLGELWRTGAAAWTHERRTQAANDLRNLLAVAGKVNAAKSDKPADEWLPKITTGYRCAFARITITIKAEYQLTITTAERAALAGALAECR